MNILLTVLLGCAILGTANVKGNQVRNLGGGHGDEYRSVWHDSDCTSDDGYGSDPDYSNDYADSSDDEYDNNRSYSSDYDYINDYADTSDDDLTDSLYARYLW